MGKCCDAVKKCCGEEKQMKSQAKTGAKKQRKKRSDAGVKRKGKPKAGHKDAKSKTHSGKDYTGHKGDIKKSAGKDVAKDNKKRDYEKPKKQRKKRSDAGVKRGARKAKASTKAKAKPSAGKKQRKKRSDAGVKRKGKAKAKSTAKSSTALVKTKAKKKKVPMKQLANRPYNQTLPPLRQVMSSNSNLPPPSAYMGRAIVPFVAPPQAKKRQSTGGRGRSKDPDCNKKIKSAYRSGIARGKKLKQ
jgi:hypothetical protein